MCIFSRDVDEVFGTKIFARLSTNGSQFLVYSMGYAADLELAMILPLPTPVTCAEDAIRFIDLSDYPEFFDDMSRVFPAPRSVSLNSKSVLKVHSVGHFETSFVPHSSAFNRLDPRFRLPDQLWAQLPQYRDYGFAVFKLKAGENEVHPMAFEFPTCYPTTLFFPTVHIHDGQVHAHAQFNHILYCQADGFHQNWEHSVDSSSRFQPINAMQFVDMEKSQGVVEPTLPIQKLHISGMQANTDFLLDQVPM